MSGSLRELTDDDLDGSYRLGRLAFGGPAEPSSRWHEHVRRMQSYGVDGPGGDLAGVVRVRPYDQLYGGRAVPMGGLAGVAVAPEHRRRGVSRALLADLLPVLRESGYAVSALYPTVPAVYRRYGWEIAGVMSRQVLQTAHLAGVRADPTVSLRQVGPDDEPHLLALYTAWAREGSGMLTRTGTQYPPGELLGADSVVLAERDGTPTGYYALDRPGGSDGTSQLTAHEIVAADAGTWGTLLHSIGAYAPLVPAVQLVAAPGSGLDLVCPAAQDSPGHANPWMLRMIDAAAAVAARGWPATADAVVPLRLRDELAPWNAGDVRLVVARGRGQLEPGTVADRPDLDGRGLAALYSGHVRCAELRRVGLLSGTSAHDAMLDALFGGPRPAMMDYF